MHSVWFFKNTIKTHTTWNDSNQHATKHFSVFVEGKKFFSIFSISKSEALSLILHVFIAYLKIASKFESWFCNSNSVPSIWKINFISTASMYFEMENLHFSQSENQRLLWIETSKNESYSLPFLCWMTENNRFRNNCLSIPWIVICDF